MKSHLETLVGSALQLLAVRATAVPLKEIEKQARAQPPPRDFVKALRSARDRGAALIAEIKRASPSRGSLAPDLEPAHIAAAYAAGGAACLSVLTDRTHFSGSLEDLVAARAACALPVLRKDFLVTPYQIFEARAHGADAVLLIAAALTKGRLQELRTLAASLRLAVLVEIHDEAELEAAQACKPDLLGVNARDLKTLDVDRDCFARIAPGLPSNVFRVAESGIRGTADLLAYAGAGADAVLVGEGLVTSGDPRGAVADLVTAGTHPSCPKPAR